MSAVWLWCLVRRDTPFPAQHPAACVPRGMAPVLPVGSDPLLATLGWDPSSTGTAACCPFCNLLAVAHRGFSKSLGVVGETAACAAGVAPG